MAKIYNSDLTKGLAKNAGIQQNTDKIPNELAEKVVPTCETNPELLRKITIVRDITITDSSSGTIYTTPTNQDFYLTDVQMDGFKSAAAGTTEFYITVTINGATKKIISMHHPTTTAINNLHAEKSFLLPIKLDRNTNITLNSNNATTFNRVIGIICGYVDECSLS